MAYYVDRVGNFENNFPKQSIGCYLPYIQHDTGNFNGTHINITNSENSLNCGSGCPAVDYGGHVVVQNDNDQRVVVEPCVGRISADILLAPETSGAGRKSLSNGALGLVFLLVLTSLIPTVVAFDALGIVSGIMTIVGFGMDQAAPSRGPHVEVSIAAGYNGPQRNGGTLNDAEGQTPYVLVRNVVHEPIAQNWFNMIYDSNAGGKSIAWKTFGHSGEDRVREIPWDSQTSGDNWDQASEIEIYPGRNGICVAWINVANPAGAKGPMLYGDVAHWCGKRWYTSGWYHSGGIADCMWMSNHPDKPNGWIKGMSYDGPYFNLENDHDPQQLMDATCNVENLNLERPNIYPLGDAFYSKRSEEDDGYNDYLNNLSNDLIISDDGNATELCLSDSSYGQSFFSIQEGLLCEMGSKVLYPSCQGTPYATCFDTDNLVVKGGSSNKREVITFNNKSRWHAPYSDKHPKRGLSNHVHVEEL